MQRAAALLARAYASLAAPPLITALFPRPPKAGVVLRTMTRRQALEARAETPRARAAAAAALPAELRGELREDLKGHQMVAAAAMHREGREVPAHMRRTPPALTVIPARGAHPCLSVALRKQGGRNCSGKITVRHRGGGFKRRIRILDRLRASPDDHVVVRIEHDPNRSSKIALMQNVRTKELSYYLAWEGAAPGVIVSNSTAESGGGGGGGGDDDTMLTQWPAGSTHCLADIPLGTAVHNVELHPGRGGQLARSAGCKGVLVSKHGPERPEAPAAGVAGAPAYVPPYLSRLQMLAHVATASIEMPSGKVVRVDQRCRATVGAVGNGEWHLRVIGKAGRNRNLGWRPTVRGVAMNAVDHPHGGGKGGRGKGKPSQSPWGKICK